MQKQILIVDDEASIRKLFARVLGAENCHILTAASGAAALALFRQERVDLVLLDLNMPGKDGADTLLELRKLDQTVPVLIVTSFKDAFIDKLTRLRDAGFYFDVVNKPVDKEHLRAVVQSALYRPDSV